MSELVSVTDHGLYCEAGDFYIDPWRPVERAIITHAHADHARPGNGRYLTAAEGEHVLRLRIGQESLIDTLPYGESLRRGDVTVSFHPAGHVLGSSQILIEARGSRCVVSGDYKLEADETCSPFVPVECDSFITECTFGLPIYRWPPQQVVFAQINAWWRENHAHDRPSIIFAYALGKAQRILAGIDSSIGPIYCHGAVERVNAAYRNSGIALPATTYAGTAETKLNSKGVLIVAPPSAMNSPWTRRFSNAATAFASGWMRVRGFRRRRRVDRGFVLSDHADWSGLLHAIEATGAERILATHGQTSPMVRWLTEQGHDAATLTTEYVGERDDAEIDATTSDEGERMPTDGGELNS